MLSLLFVLHADKPLATETNGHTGAAAQNGNNEPTNGVTNNTNNVTPVTPTTAAVGAVIPKNEMIHLDRTNQDIVRLIEQYLVSVGLE